jgi:glutamate-1-semialdehyde 2,1-aminomutase
MTEARAALPDLQFTGRYRVPFQYSPYLRASTCRSAASCGRSQRREVEDLDGNIFYRPDRLLRRQPVRPRLLQGVHRRGRRARPALGPVLGSLPPVRARQRRAGLRRACRAGRGVVPHVGHRSGDAGRAAGALPHRAQPPGALLRRLPRLVGGRAARAGQPAAAARDLHAARRWTKRPEGAAHARDIACVLVNPLQALHPNATRRATRRWSTAAAAGVDREAYTRWLQQLRQVCSERGIVLIFDEVFVGFRLAPGGAQEYFGVRADMVTYGKTLGGGLPVGVVCGRRDLMQRFREERPADICFARGTFNSHPYVMAAMKAFLERLESAPRCGALRRPGRALERRAPRDSTRRCDGRPAGARGQSVDDLDRAVHPPSRYNWMLQFYLRAQGLALELGGQRSPDLQPELQRCGLRGRAAPLRRRRHARCRRDGWWWRRWPQRPTAASDLGRSGARALG